MKLNLQTIRIAEQLLGKPFGEFELTSEKDADMLAYSLLVASSDENFSYSTYKHLSDKVKAKALKQLTSDFSFLQQFSKEETETKSKPVYMGEVAATLIMEGMDARYVLYEMGVFELKDYLAALDTKIKNKFENSRLWTFYTILPHVDAKKLKSPKDLFLFPWEVEEDEKERLIEFEKGVKMFEKFMKSKPKRYGNR
jgi:hypothetical protein